MKKNFFGIIAILIILSSANHTQGYSKDYMSSDWNYTLPEVISDMNVGDLDGDGDLEIVVSASSSGQLQVIDRHGQLLWKYGYPGYLYSNYIYDLNRDGKKEVFAGTGDRVHILNPEGELYDKFYTSGVPAKIIREANLGADETRELVVAGYNTNVCEDNFVFVFGEDGKLISTPYNVGLSIPFSVASGQLEEEGNVLVGLISRTKSTGRKSCDPAYNTPGKILVLDKGLKTSWEYETAGGVTTILVADIEGDNSPEVLVGTYPTLYVFSKKGRLKWTFEGVSLIHQVLSEDITGDGKPEILVASDHLYVLDNQGNQLWRGFTDNRAYSIASADLDGDGLKEVVVGSDRIYVFNSLGEKLWDSENLVTVDNVFTRDVDLDGYPDVIAGSVKQVHLFKTKTFAQSMSADGLLYKARLALQSGNFDQAIEQSALALKLYSEIDDVKRMAEALNVQKEANKSATNFYELSSEAEIFFRSAKVSLEGRDYENAILNARKARELYTNNAIRNSQRILESDQMISNSIFVLRNQASENLELAQNFFTQNDLTNAKKYAIKSKETYDFLEDENEAAKAKRIISASTTTKDVFEEIVEDIKSTDFKAIISQASPRIQPKHFVFVLAIIVVFGLFFIILPKVYRSVNSRTRRKYLKPEHLLIPKKRLEPAKVGKRRERRIGRKVG
ncbi:MAG: FG-GAP-like repeat-containing protein [Candidatus Altiarchaeota archaeon]